MLPHDPINITNNADLEFVAKEEGWKGDGTKNNPYIIENYDIVSNKYMGCLKLRDINKHIIIRNCKFGSYFKSDIQTTHAIVYLDNVSNCQFINNQFDDSSVFTVHGIKLFHCHNNIIAQNNIPSQHSYCIAVAFSNHNIIFNNRITNTITDGMMLDNSPNNIIVYNTISTPVNRHATGITLEGEQTQHCIVSHNTIKNTANFSIFVLNASNSIIQFNKLSQCPQGIILYSATHCQVVNNYFLGVKQTITIEGSSKYNHVIGNVANYTGDETISIICEKPFNIVTHNVFHNTPNTTPITYNYSDIHVYNNIFRYDKIPEFIPTHHEYRNLFITL